MPCLRMLAVLPRADSDSQVNGALNDDGLAMSFYTKFGNIKDIWYSGDKCIRDRTTYKEMLVCNVLWPCWLALLLKKCQECAIDPKNQYNTAKEIAELLGQPPPSPESFGLSSALGASMSGGGRPTGQGLTQQELDAQQHETRAFALAYELLGKPCTADATLADGTVDRCRSGMDGSSYTIDSSRYPLTNKQLNAVFSAVKAAAMLGLDLDDQRARATEVRDAELRKLGIRPDAPSGGDPDSTDGSSSGGRKPKLSMAQAGMGIVGALVAVGTAIWLGRQLAKAK